ncbi:MAG: T9SS type A sorting domain-containing protein [Candidatus Cloacimonetes bacterium]|nr:T9SS type A sorting domain-containing protein [Candidatus Cloacimonadota bacterium]
MRTLSGVALGVLAEYLGELAHENLVDIVLTISALTQMFDTNYAEAIILYDVIISDPPNEIEGLYAKLNQAYCYYRLVSGGTRTDPPLSHHQPSTFAEYQSLEADILSKINSSFFPDAEPPIEIPSEPLVFSTSHYPNPFNPETTIAFTIPADSKVELNIYNIKGQRVKKLINSPYTAGNHKIVWNGKNEQGQQVSSGIYFYQFKTDTDQDIKKMLLMK